MPEAQSAVHPARSTSQRKTDVLAKLSSEVDLWVASADAAGNAYLVPLSYHWDGASLLIATPRASRTGRNLLRAGRARAALGGTRDVVLVDATLGELDIAGDTPLGDAFARDTGFDPRDGETPYVYLRLVPETVQAWREEDELAGRVVMRGGRWLGRDG